MRKLSVSIVSGDLGRITDQVKEVEKSGADWIHIDVMDGHFVPNITVGPAFVQAVRNATTLPLDVHLMIEKPDFYLEQFIDAGADWLGIHVEAAVHLERLVARIKELGAMATVTLNPATPLSSIEVILEEIDMVLLMTVNPGFSGQKFIPAVIPKIQRLKEIIDKADLPVLIEVDGGIHMNTIESVIEAGADVIVSGSAVFADGEIGGNIKALKSRLSGSFF